MLLCVTAFILYFVAQDWQYNYPARLINWINGLDEIRKGRSNIIFSFHGIITLFSIYGLYSLYILKTSDNKQKWFGFLLRKWFDKLF